MKRVFILSSRPLLGDGIETLLQNEMTLDVVGKSRDRRKALEQIKLLQPDVVIVDRDRVEDESTLQMLHLLSSNSNARVIGLDLNANVLWISRHERRPVREFSDLLRAIQA